MLWPGDRCLVAGQRAAAQAQDVCAPAGLRFGLV